MNYYLQSVINLLLAALPVIIGAFNFKILDYGAKVIYELLVLSLLTEILAVFFAYRYRNNTPVINISNLLQSFFICLYFNYCIKIFRKRHIGVYIGLFSIIAGILNMVFLEPINTYNSNYFLFQTILVFALGIIFYIQMLSLPYFKLQTNPHFWFIVVLISFYVLNYFALSLYTYFASRFKNHNGIIDLSVFFLNCLTNIGFSIVLAYYPKMKTNAR